MLAELCQKLNNWFEIKNQYGEPTGRLYGTFTISGGTLKVEGAQPGQYIRVCDSVFNDGIYEYPVTGLTDETFDGAIWILAIPPDVVNLSKEIDAWKEKYGDVLLSPYTSESFGGYSYSKASTGSADGSGTTWMDIFADQLKRWQKV